MLCAIIILSGTLIMINIYSFELKRKNQIQASVINKMSEDYNLKNELFNNTLGLQFESDNSMLNTDLYVHSISDDSVLLKDILGQEPIIVFCFNELGCKVCAEIEMSNLKELAKEIGINNIIILASYKNIRDLAVMLRINQIKFPFYNLNHKRLGVRAEDYNTPFIFISLGDMSGKFVFIPRKENPDMSFIYYNIIKEKFFK